MKFFTYRLWLEMQGPKHLRAQEEWSTRRQRYLAQLGRLRLRLGRAFFRFVTGTGFHDAQLIAIETGRPAQLVLLLDQGGTRRRLTFDGMKEWRVDCVSRKDDLSLQRGLEWGYEEFSASGRSDLRVDILFSSGSTFQIVFRKVRIRTVRA